MNQWCRFLARFVIYRETVMYSLSGAEVLGELRPG